MKVAFSSLYFFQNFSVNILPALKSLAFTWCQECQTILKQFSKNIPKFKFYKKLYNSALRPLNNMPYSAKCL